MTSVRPGLHCGDIAIRPWAADDAPQVDALLGAIGGHDRTVRPDLAAHGPARDEPGAFHRTLVAEVDRRVVAVATVWEYRLHPTRWRFAAHVGGDHRRRGIGSALFGRLLAEVAPRGPRPWQAATSADDRAARGFLARHGFQPLMRTRLGEVDPAVLVDATWEELAAATATATDAGYRIVALPDLPAGVPLRPSLASLHAEVYRQAHGWNPPAALSEEDARRLFLGDDLIPGSLFVALAADRPVGVASLRLGASPDDRELGWIGVAEGHHKHAAPLTAALLGRCVSQALAQRRSVRVEVDEADRHFWHLVDALPVRRDPDWLTFARADPTTSPPGA